MLIQTQHISQHIDGIVGDGTWMIFNIKCLIDPSKNYDCMFDFDILVFIKMDQYCIPKLKHI